MARKTPRKKQRSKERQDLINRYNRQVARIKKNYADIESMGGRFSQDVMGIIRPPKRIEESTVRRLKAISKNDLYRMARTETDESGWKLKTYKLQEAQIKSRITRWETELAKQYFGEYWDSYTKKDKEWARKEARELRYEELGLWKKNVEQEAESYQEPEEPYQWVREPEPEPEPEPIDYEEPETDYSGFESFRDQFSEDIGGSRQYRNSMIDLIRDEIRANDDYDLIRDLGDKFEDMVEEMTDTELQQWVEDYGHDFLDNVKHVIKYRTKETVAKKYYDQCVSMLHSGITPLDQFYKDENFYDKDEAELYKGTWYNADTGEILDNGRRFKDHTRYINIDNNAEYKDGQLSWVNVAINQLPKGLRQRDLSTMGYSPSEIEEILDEEYGE